MLFRVDSKKSDYHGKSVFVPNFARLNMDDRNKVSAFIGNYGETPEEPLWQGLIVPFIGLAWMGLLVFGVVNEITALVVIMGLMLPCLFLLFIVCGIGMCIVDARREPKLDDIPYVATDDLSWKRFMLAFDGKFVLWDKMIGEISVGHKHWRLPYASKLAINLSNAVSDYFSSSGTPADGVSVVRAVERIFAEHEAEAEEVKIAQQAKEEARLAGEKLVFDQQLQMAREDVNHYRLSSPMLNL